MTTDRLDQDGEPLRECFYHKDCGNFLTDDEAWDGDICGDCAREIREKRDTYAQLRRDFRRV